MKIGKKWATSLTGFIAGATFAAIILTPWMLFQNHLQLQEQLYGKAAFTFMSISPSFEAAPPAEAPTPAPSPAPVP